ncbi:triple tyrosine motif-containing protein [Mucilaginibacter gynuensis]|uniref:Triple tyrosine motif-containing protein n=1 Tax=Mucilaginibacter gynuensis TaxID=1302236 RepID=A0ABP8FX23_9SPHI
MPVFAFAQLQEQLGAPKIIHYDRSDYNAYNQNWAIAQDEQGIMYFANSKGLLLYNGNQWQISELPLGQVVRTVAIDPEGRIYTGGYAEIGYWEKSLYGKLKYHSYADSVHNRAFKQEEIWHVITVGNGEIYFQSLSTIYHLKNNAVEVVSSQHPFENIKLVNGVVYAMSTDGLFEIRNNKLSLVPGSTSISKEGIDDMVPYALNQLLLCSSTSKLFIYDNKTFKPFASEAQSFLTGNPVLNILRIAENRFAFSTLQNGVIVTDGFGKIIYHFSKNTGLASNSALALLTDKKGNLWVGLDGGVSQVLLQSPFLHHKDGEGKFGVVNSAAFYREKLYLATANGLFYLNSPESKVYEKLKQFAGPVQSVETIDDHLFLSTTTGTYTIYNDVVSKISNVIIGWCIRPIPGKPDYVIEGSYNGLTIYHKAANGKWQLHATIPLRQWLPSKDVVVDDQGIVWVKHLYYGIFKIKLSNDLKSTVSVQVLGKHSGLPASGKLNLFRYKNTIRITGTKGIFYEDTPGHFKPDIQLKQKLGDYFFAKRIIADYDPEWWIINDDNSISHLKWIPDGKPDIKRFGQRNFYLLNDFEHIRKLRSLYLFCTEDGFSMYNSQQPVSFTDVSAPIINEVNVLNGGNPVPVAQVKASGEIIQLPYRLNNLSISWGMPEYDSRKMYSYRVNGMPGYEEWSRWSAAYQKQFDNMPAGRYTFQVRSDISDKITSLSFVILSPWYFTLWAKILYILILAGLLYLLYRAHRRRLVQQRLRLEAHTEQLVQQQRKDNQHELMTAQQQKLTQEVLLKSEHLANSSINLIEKKAVLNKIKKALADIKDEAGPGFPVNKYNRLIKMINNHTGNDNDLKLFEESFDQIHDEFFKKLLKEYPDLAPPDLKLAAYLKMNLTTKEIAPLLNITLRGVEVKRYRLRKRLKLSSDQNLIEFMMNI